MPHSYIEPPTVARIALDHSRERMEAIRKLGTDSAQKVSKLVPFTSLTRSLTQTPCQLPERLTVAFLREILVKEKTARLQSVSPLFSHVSTLPSAPTAS